MSKIAHMYELESYCWLSAGNSVRAEGQESQFFIGTPLGLPHRILMGSKNKHFQIQEGKDASFFRHRPRNGYSVIATIFYWSNIHSTQVQGKGTRHYLSIRGVSKKYRVMFEMTQLRIQIVNCGIFGFMGGGT